MVAVSLAGSALLVSPVSSAHAALRVAPRSAVPGQVVTMKAPRGARVRIGGKQARVLGLRRGRLRVVVPALRAGRAKVAVRAGKRRLRGRLRARRGFSGRVRPTLERGRTVSRSIGPAGGTVTATSASGTSFALALPPGAVRGPTTISLTPVKQIKGFPLRGPRFAVQLSPDGLALLEPATLTITLKRSPRGKLVGFVYDGSGRNFDLNAARRSGRTIVLTVEHFSTAGSTHITGRDLIILLGKLTLEIVRGTLDLDDVHLFAVAWSVLFVGNTSLCTADPTCFFVFSGVNDELDEQMARYGCVEGNVLRGSDAIEALGRALAIDGDLRLVGNNGKAAAFERERLCLTTSLVADADPPAQTDALGATRVPLTDVDRTRADSDADGTLNNCEFAVFVGGIAAQQGFARLQGQATDACESGLRKVLDDGVARCDQDRQDGLGRLGDGQKVALGVGLLTAEFQAAIDNCKPKLFVTPSSATVEVGQTVSFSARTNEGDGAFDWTASTGTITGGGTLTAPDEPGTVTVTATTRRILSGSATVTVKCPAGQVEFDGECRTISVTIAPANPSLAPSAQQQFTATVHNTTNQGVTWTSSGGSISTTGTFTAPSQPGTVTITARSKEDTTKTGTTTVSVLEPGVNVFSRSSEVSSVDAHAQTTGADNNCPFLPAVIDHDFLVRSNAGGPLGSWDSGDVGASASSGPLFCQGSNASSSASITTRTIHDVQSADGDLTATFSATDSHDVEMTYAGTAVNTRVFTSTISLLGVGFDVVQETVELSCSTTLSGDPRDPQPQEVEDQVFELRIDTQAGQNMLLIEDTTAPTTVTLAPGRYAVVIENKTVRRRDNQPLSLDLSFGSAGECHRVA